MLADFIETSYTEFTSTRKRRREEMTMENRSVATCIILSIVTCGIYSIFWTYKIAQGFYVTPTQERVNTSPGTTVLLFILTGGIYGIFCYYKWGQATAEIAARYGRGGEDKALMYLLLSIFGLAIICDALIQTDFNEWTSIPPGGGQPPYQGGPYQGGPPPYQGGPYQQPPQ